MVHDTSSLSTYTLNIWRLLDHRRRPGREVTDPTARVIRVILPQRPGGAYVVEVVRPHSGKTHTHGLGVDGDLWGHRVAHCRTKDRELFAGYEIEKPANGSAVVRLMCRLTSAI